MITRMQRRRQKYGNKKIVLFADKKIVFFSVIVGLICSMALWANIGWSEAAFTVSKPAGSPNSLQVNVWPRWRDILFSGIPGLASMAEAQSAVHVKRDVSIQNLLHGTVLFFTSVDPRDLRSVLKAEIPILAALKTGQPSVSAMSLPNFPKFDPASIASKGKPLVGIYHTHTAESFILSSGVAHVPGGQRGEIVDVGEAMVKRLEKQGVPALQDKTIHDFPSFMKAYGASEVTVQKMLAENPSIQMIFDIHRDADKRENSTATVNGVEVAKITILVATGQPDLPQPQWQQNHAFAKLLDAKLNQHYPGVSKGIQLVEWRYNQHLHPRALLIEVGCQENSREEAERSIELLADVVAQIIAENNN